MIKCYVCNHQNVQIFYQENPFLDDLRGGWRMIMVTI